MGVDCATFVQLCELATRFQTEDRALMLGRQKFRYFAGRKQLRIPYKRHFQRALDKYGHDLKIDDIVQADTYSETMFQALGLGRIETMDVSDYEFGKEEGFVGHIHDLNDPVPEEHYEKYDFVFDGGTLEHIFNVPVALENIFHMLRPGGRFVGVNPLNGWPGHGMYQFNPELQYTFWVRKCGSEVINCYAMSVNPGGFFKVMKDPANLTGRSKVRRNFLIWKPVPRGQIHLYTEVKKTGGQISDEPIMQTSYVRRWASAT